MLSRLRRYFFVGVFTVAPFALTLYVLLLFARWFDSLFQPIIRTIMQRFFENPIALPGVGIFIGVILIIFIGMLAPSFLGKQIVNITERIMAKIPLGKIIYSAARQIFDAFSASGAQKFSKVVMVPFPMKGMWACGFVTKEQHDGWVPNQENTKLAVFVPTTPNPTSGWLMFVDPREAVALDLTVEEGLKLVISGGLASPDKLYELTHPKPLRD